ncbi:MAG: serine/threonine-protein kinase, partial [Terriglobales bacterium]
SICGNSPCSCADTISELEIDTISPVAAVELFEKDLHNEFDNRFRFETLIGKGGMGVIYKAQDIALNRAVAIKVLRSQRFLDRNVVVRFQREAQAASRLDHPNVIKVLEFGVLSANEPYLVLEYVDGQSLTRVIRDKHFMAVERVVRLAMQIAAALSHAHERGVLHRDLKPDNIVLTGKLPNEQIKLLDFGIAKVLESGVSLTQTGDIFGSPLYMSPEQCQGHRMDARSDIYSFGCCLYEMLVGTPPFVGTSMLHTMQMHANEQPFSITVARPDVPKELEEVVFTAIAKMPQDRYQNVEELRQALIALNLVELRDLQPQESQTLKTLEASPPRPRASTLNLPQVKRRPWRRGAIAGTAIAFGVLAALTFEISHLQYSLHQAAQKEEIRREGEALFQEGKVAEACTMIVRQVPFCVDDE